MYKFSPMVFGVIASIFASCATPDRINAPNIVFLFADDQRSGTLNLGGKGNSEIMTPNLDALAARGALFNNAYVFGADQTSVCYPSRAQLLSGKNLFRYKTLDLPSQNIDDFNLPVALRLAGYHTMRSGKANNVPYGINMEFNVNVEHGNRGSVKGNLAYFQDAIDFLDQKPLTGLADVTFAWDGKSPFFIYLAVGTPHAPYPAQDKHLAMYDWQEITAPEDALIKHPVLSTLIRKTVTKKSSIDQVKKELKEYYASITFMDEQFGKLVAVLKDKGLYKNTIFVFAGDNGLSIGSHALEGKANLMQYGGMHVPLILAGPGIKQQQSDALVYLTDIFPTLTEFADAPNPKSLDGKSLINVLSGKSEKVRDALLTAYTRGAEQRAVRDQRWKLFYFPDKKIYELYDLQNDPRELHNLSKDSEYAAELKRMKDLLAQEQQRYRDPYPEKARIKRVYNKKSLADPDIDDLLEKLSKRL